MKSPFVRRKHVDLADAISAMSDPTIPMRDAMVIWRKALRRVDGRTKELLDLAKLHFKERRSMSSHPASPSHCELVEKNEVTHCSGRPVVIPICGSCTRAHRNCYWFEVHSSATKRRSNTCPASSFSYQEVDTS
jgi:hypothetical protein